MEATSRDMHAVIVAETDALGLSGRDEAEVRMFGFIRTDDLRVRNIPGGF